MKASTSGSDSQYVGRSRRAAAFVIALSCLLPVAVGQQPNEVAEGVTADRLKPHVELLSSPEFEGRSRQGARIAANYIVSRFKALGLEPIFEGRQSYYQGVLVRRPEIPKKAPAEAAPSAQSAASDKGPAEKSVATVDSAKADPAKDDPQKFFTAGYNVAAVLPGSDPALAGEYVILSAHFDHLGVIKGQLYPGADDNASGVSMLLEVARVLAAQKIRPRRSILFVGFDLEEAGLVGSYYFAAHPPLPLAQVKLFITADMIGRSAADVATEFVFVVGSEHAPELREHVGASRTEESLHVGYLGVDLIGSRSDYAAFRDKQVPLLFFSTGEHPHYHSPQDTADRIDYDKLARISRLICRTVIRASDADQLPGWRNEPLVDLEEVKAVHRVLSKMLKSPGVMAEGSVQRFLASNTCQTMQLILDRGTLTAAERTWLSGICKILLATELGRKQ